MHPPVEKGAGGQHHGAATEANTDLRDHARHAVALDDDVIHRLLEQPQIGLVLQPAADGRPVQHPVGLRTRGAHRLTLALLRMRNWMPASSVASAMAPPSASISLTRWPLPMPPIDGLQLICPSVSRLCVKSSVRQPMRAAASAASVPAWPPPTTIRSNSLG